MTTRSLGATALGALRPAIALAALLISSLAVLPTAVRAQAIVPVLGHLPFSAGRALGMGGAGCAIVRGATGSDGNPAAVAFLQQDPVVVEITQAPDGSADWPNGSPKEVSPDPGSLRARLPRYSGPPAAEPESCDQASASPLLTASGVTCGLGGRRLRGARWAWGASADASASLDARHLRLGVLCSLGRGWSLGARWDQISAQEATTITSPAVGAAYDQGSWTLAADLCRAAGASAQDRSTRMGVEHRLRSGLAVRLGSAGGEPTFGLGYRRGVWRVDVARVPSEGAPLAAPLSPLRAMGGLTVLSVASEF